MLLSLPVLHIYIFSYNVKLCKYYCCIQLAFNEIKKAKINLLESE